MKGILFLAGAILFEVIGSTMLKFSNGFTIMLPSLGVILGFMTSFTFFGYALKSIPLSTAYAVWAGVGTALTACVGVILFQENINLLKILALLTIIAGIVFLNKSKDPKEKKESSSPN